MNNEEDRPKEVTPLIQENGSPSPALLEWVLGHHTDEEIIAWYQEMKQKGGRELSEFIQDLEKAVNGTRAP
jgi:hypothetical protein